MDAQLLGVLRGLHTLDLNAEPALQTRARWLVLDTLGCIMAGLRSEPVLRMAQGAAVADPADHDQLAAAVPQLAGIHARKA